MFALAVLIIGKTRRLFQCSFSGLKAAPLAGRYSVVRNNTLMPVTRGSSLALGIFWKLASAFKLTDVFPSVLHEM